MGGIGWLTRRRLWRNDGLVVGQYVGVGFVVVGMGVWMAYACFLLRHDRRGYMGLVLSVVTL
jgi:hypothetical protein